MSKKKATMTLKDFHGGSIPSDLSLPSAPGVTVRPVGHGGFDQQKSWGNSVDRFDNRLRPASSVSAKNLDAKTPFLSYTSHIGHNFDEDERKPLGGVSGLRRTTGDENIHFQSSHAEAPNLGAQSSTKTDSRPASVPVTQIASGLTGSSYAGRVSELNNAKLNHQTSSGNVLRHPITGGITGQAVVGSNQNAWGIKKETAGMRYPDPDPAVKLAHASALEKVSSGLWSSKQNVNPSKDAEATEKQETQGEFEYERARSTVPVEPYKLSTSVTADEMQSRQPTGKFGGSEFQSTWSSEPSGRPKLQLLPRSRPLENLGQTVEHNQEHQQILAYLHVEDDFTVQEPKNPLQSGLLGPMVGDHAPERPKLNLKPRSQTLEQTEANSEIRRGTIFGGARPREVILKERGIEDDISRYDSQLHVRIKEGVPKVETFVNGTERAGSIPPDQKTAQYFETEDHQRDGERTALQRSRPNEILRNDKNVERQRNQHPKQLLDQPLSPEFWHKPIDRTKPVSPDVLLLRHGKAASAVELAEAFSKSVSSSDPTAADGFSGAKGIPSHGKKMPFSRLMGPSPTLGPS